VLEIFQAVWCLGDAPTLLYWVVAVYMWSV